MKQNSTLAAKALRWRIIEYLNEKLVWVLVVILSKRLSPKTSNSLLLPGQSILWYFRVLLIHNLTHYDNRLKLYISYLFYVGIFPRKKMSEEIARGITRKGGKSSI